MDLLSAQNKAHVLYIIVNSRVTREFGPSNSTKIQEHMHVAARECQLRRERYRTEDRGYKGVKDDMAM